jgi:hypothetical protein
MFEVAPLTSCTRSHLGGATSCNDLKKRKGRPEGRPLENVSVVAAGATASAVVSEIAATRPRTVFPRIRARLLLDDFGYTIGNRLNHTIKISIFPNTLDCMLDCVFLKSNNDDNRRFIKAPTVASAFRNYSAPCLNLEWKFMFDCGDRIIRCVHIPQNNVHPL